MRKIKFWILTLAAILTLVSLRDKEVVLRVPAAKQLVAEAYQPPSGSQSPGASTGANSISGAQSQSRGSSDYYDDSTNTGGNIPSGASQDSPASSLPPTSEPKTLIPSEDIFYGLGGVINLTSDTNQTQDLADGRGASDGTQKLLSPNPVYITGLLPGSAKGGVEVVIQGAGFGVSASGNTVKFGSAQSTSVRAVSVNQLRAAVPQGLADGFKDITVSAESNSKPALFDALKDTAAAVFINNINTALPAGLNLQDSSIVRFADIDGDKDLDMLVVDKVSGKLYLLINNGSGHFTDATSRLPSAVVNSASYITDVVFGDVDNDGTQDMLVSYSQGQTVMLLANSVSGAFTDVTTAKIPALSGNAAAIDLGDADGDGYLDVIAANRDSKDILLVNDGTGKFDKDAGFVLPATIDGSSDIRFCDIDSDGDLDIITTNRDVVGSSVLQNRIYLNNGSGVFNDATDIIMPPDTENSEVLDIGDLNRDGYIDLIIGCYGQNLLLLNNGGVFEDRTAELMPTNDFHTRDIKLGDLNGDGYLDLIALGEDKASLFMNNGTGSFKESDASIKLPDYKSVPALVGGRNVHLADIDGDGALDIVIGGSSLRILTSSAVNKAPVLEPIGNRQVEEGKALIFNINAADPNGDALVYSARNLPSGATFQTANKLFNWTPGLGTAGEYNNIVFKAAEDKASPLEDSEAITITVTSGDLPVIDYYMPIDLDIETAVGDIVQFGLRAHDPKGGALTFKWLFNGNEIPNIGYSDSSVIFIIPKMGQNTIEVRVNNATGTVSVKWNLFAGENLPPVIDTHNPADHQDIDLTQGAAINFNITAHDPEGDLLSYTWKLDSIVLNGGTNKALDASSFLATLKTGTHELTVEVSDGYNQPVIHQWALDVTQSPGNSAPVIVSHTPPEDLINIDLTQGAALAFGITATDPDGDILTYIWRLDGIALSSTTKDLSSGAYASQLKEGDLPLSVSINDGHQHTVTQVWTLHVTQGPVYILAVNAVNGSVGKNPDKTTYSGGDQVTLTAAPSAGYTFGSWSGDISGSTNPATITMNANKTVTANFTAIPPLTITASAGAGGSISPSGSVSTAYGASQTFTVTPDSGYLIDQVLVDSAAVALTAGTYTFTNVTVAHTITASFAASISISDQIIQKSFSYLWNETDNPETGFTRDRLPVKEADRNSTFDIYYNRASLSATGFQLAALCVADNDPGVAGGVTHDQLVARATLIMTRLLEIQSNQKPSDPSRFAKWGRDGFFYHFVDIDTGERYPGSEVSTIDTAILVAGVITAGDYFGGDLKDKALQIYGNVNWKAFLDTKKVAPNNSDFANPFYNQFYHAWDPETVTDGGFYGHWDYTSEGLLLYLLAAVTPAADNAVPSDAFYAIRRELGNYGANGNPMVKSWSGALLEYQYTQAFFNFKDSSDNALYDKQGVAWWSNSVEAAKANKQFCNDSINKFAGQEDLWGLTAGYTDGFTYSVRGAPPAGADVSGADGTIFPAAAGCAIPFLPDETMRALDKMKELYDTYNYQVWGDYGFVNSFKLGGNLDVAPSPIAAFYCGIDIGSMLVMAANNKNHLIWDRFSDFEIAPGVTLKARMMQVIGLTTDRTHYLIVDGISDLSNFHTGKIDAQKPQYQVKFNLSAVGNAPYLLSVHSFMNKDLPDHTINVNIKINNADPFPAEFTYNNIGKDPDLMKYITINSNDLVAGENTITLEWQGATIPEAKWLAWKNVEVSSPVENNVWAFARNETVTPKVLFGNEYRTDDTYSVGADISGFEQAINKDTDKFTDILFYTSTPVTEYAALTLKALETHNDAKTNVRVFVNGAPAQVFTGALVTGDQITTPGFHLVKGWNRITLYHPGTTGAAPSEWIRWDSVSLTAANPSKFNPPQGLGAAGFGYDKVNLRWQAVNGIDVKYNVYRSLSQGGPYEKINASPLASAQYQDTGRTNGATYYYAVTALTESDQSSESNLSPAVAKTVGGYDVDYRDGRDPDALGGLSSAHFSYSIEFRHDFTDGPARKLVLSPGETGLIGLNGVDVSQTNTLSVWINGTGSEKIEIGLANSGSGPAVFAVTAASGWQNFRIELSDFSGVAVSNLDKLSITNTSAGAITLFLDDIAFITEAPGTAALDVGAKNIADNSISTGISFDYNSASTSAYAPANQYLRVSYNSPSANNWKIWIYTRNDNGDAQSLGGMYNGLMKSDGKARVALIWRIYPDVQSGGIPCRETSDVYNGALMTWNYLKDKNDSDWLSANQTGAEYSVICFGNKNEWAWLAPVPTADRKPAGNSFCVYIGGEFGAANPGDYSASIYLDITHE